MGGCFDTTYLTNFIIKLSCHARTLFHYYYQSVG